SRDPGGRLRGPAEVAAGGHERGESKDRHRGEGEDADDRRPARGHVLAGDHQDDGARHSRQRGGVDGIDTRDSVDLARHERGGRGDEDREGRPAQPEEDDHHGQENRRGGDPDEEILLLRVHHLDLSRIWALVSPKRRSRWRYSRSAAKKASSRKSGQSSLATTISA